MRLEMIMPDDYTGQYIKLRVCNKYMCKKKVIQKKKDTFLIENKPI